MIFHIKIERFLTANDKRINLDNKLGSDNTAPDSIDFHISLPIVEIKANLSQFLKSSIVFLLYKIPWLVKLKRVDVGFL